MQIAFHIGANCTDEDRLLKSLLRNGDVLLQNAISVPGPGRYRSLIREAIQALAGTLPSPDARDALLDAIIERDHIQRLVMSNDNFISVPNRIFDHGVFYPQAESKTRALRSLFAEDDLSLFMGIRHPASFLQETMRRVPHENLEDYLGLLAAEDILWSDVVRRIKQGAPDVPLTIWCNEDTPLIWDEVLGLMAGTGPDVALTGALDLLPLVMTPAGLAAVTQQLAAQPDLDSAARRDLIEAVWQDHPLPDSDDDIITLPDLDADLVAHFDASYDADLAVIAAMPGVRVILP
jgi:hypothetical protein